MVDSEELFYTMFQNNYMLKSSFILFFNKKDLFEDKLKHVDLKQFYSEYKGIFTIHIFPKCEKRFIDPDSGKGVGSGVS
jgi:hypothetical protein